MMMNNINILTAIIDYIPQSKLKKVTAYDICEWCVFLNGFPIESFSDVYTYLDSKLNLIDE
tara:strand:- start:257 stop:439 length:183 start_codon:yes stop_codon:yes gene_type:complete